MFYCLFTPPSRQLSHTTSGKHPDEVAKLSLMVEDYIDGENIIVEYNLNDMFGDQD
jgi:hypothetical protein